MSLINDALKRAKQAQDRQAPPPASGVPLQPVSGPRPTRPASGVLLLLVAAVVLGAGAVILIYLGTHGGPETDRELYSKPHSSAEKRSVTTDSPAANRKPTPPIAGEREPVAAVAPKPAPPPTEPTPAANPGPASPTSATNSVSSAPPPSAVPAPGVVEAVPVATPASPALPKLQGIFYRPDRPSALLNGRTVFVGGRSGEFQVVAISQETVTVVRAGETNVLRLPE